MNHNLILCVSCLIIVACTATEWKDIKSSLDSPHYKEIFEKLLLKSAELNRADTLGIINGIPASPGQFPYQVYLTLYDARGDSYLCGGSVSSK